MNFNSNDMLATDKQINYLCSLAKKVEKVRIANEKDKTIVVHFPNYIDWQSERHLGVTKDDANIRIRAYRDILMYAQVSYKLCGTSK